MKKWNFGFVMIGLAFLISILVLSCQTDETDEYSQQAVDVTAADLFYCFGSLSEFGKRNRKGHEKRTKRNL